MSSEHSRWLLLPSLVAALFLVGSGLLTSYLANYEVKSLHAESAVSHILANPSRSINNITSVLILNSSSSGPSKSGQPAVIGNVTSGTLKRSQAFVDLVHPKVLLPPLSKNITAITNLQKQAPFVKNPSNKTVVTVINFTNSSAPRHIVSKSSSFSNLPSGAVRVLGSSLPNASSIANSPHLTRIVNKISGGFAGLSIVDSGGYTPPDVQIAAGPRHLVEMVNLQGETWAKKAISGTVFPLDQFFRTGMDSITDPRILFDNSTGRWFAAIQDITTSSIHLAVSTSGDPTGSWTVYDFPFSNCPDQPSMAASNDKFVISANDFSSNCRGSFTGAQYTVVDKNDLITSFPSPRFWQSHANITQFSVHPVNLPESSSLSTVFMVSIGSGGSNSVTVYKVNGKVPFLSVGMVTFPINSIIVPPRALQPNTPHTIDTGDARMLDAAMFQGIIWVAFNDGCRPANDTLTRSCIGLVELNTANNRVIQDFDVGYLGSYLFYPAITIDSAGNLDVLYGISSQRIHSNLYVSGQTAGSVPNTLNEPVNLTIGAGLETGPRYGDYFGLADDPSAPKHFWVAGEYNPATPFTNIEYWSTFIGNFTTTQTSTSTAINKH